MLNDSTKTHEERHFDSSPAIQRSSNQQEATSWTGSVRITENGSSLMLYKCLDTLNSCLSIHPSIHPPEVICFKCIWSKCCTTTENPRGAVLGLGGFDQRRYQTFFQSEQGYKADSSRLQGLNR